MKLKNKPAIFAVAVAASIAIVAGRTGAVAGSLVTGHDVKNESLTGADIKNGTVRVKDLSSHVNTLLKKQAAKGPKGDTGDQGDAVLGAYEGAH